MDDPHQTATKQVQFRRIRLSRKPNNLAQRYALADILAPSDCPDPAAFVRNASNAATGLQRAARLWRDRVLQLQSHGARMFSTDAVVNNALRCPSLVEPDTTRIFACHLLRICPFCWARELTLDLYARLARALEPCGGDASLFSTTGCQVPQLDIVEGHLSQLAVCQDAGELIDDLSASLNGFRNAFGLHSAGSFLLATVEPRGDQLLIRKRLVAMIAPEVKICVPDTENEKYFRWRCAGEERYSGTTLPEIVGRVTAYPAGLLLDDDVAATTALLDATSRGRGLNPRLSRTYGLLRKTSNNNRTTRSTT